MRREFIPDPKEKLSRDEAYDLCPWAAKIIAIEGGWMAFESIRDIHRWERKYQMIAKFIYAGTCKKCKRFFDWASCYHVGKNKRRGNGINKDGICKACAKKA